MGKAVSKQEEPTSKEKQKSWNSMKLRGATSNPPGYGNECQPLVPSTEGVVRRSGSTRREGEVAAYSHAV